MDVFVRKFSKEGNTTSQNPGSTPVIWVKIRKDFLFIFYTPSILKKMQSLTWLTTNQLPKYPQIVKTGKTCGPRSCDGY